MTYQFNAGDKVANDFPNPYKIENAFLLLSAFALIGGAVSILLTARTCFHEREGEIAAVSVILAFALFGMAVKFLIQALSQMRFYLGRKYPVGLADEVPANGYGLAVGALSVIEMLRHNAVEFPEPQGPLNGVLHSLIKPLFTSPPPIQAAAVRHFHAVISMMAILSSMAASYYFTAGTNCEGVISWLYLPMTGLSLLTPFMQAQAEDSNADEAGNTNTMLWKLIALASFTTLAPEVIPRYLPTLHVPPLWIAPFLLLSASMVASVIFLLSLFSQLDDVPQTSVSREQTTISMNCHPAQLWPKWKRDMQENWVRGIPNRVYANVEPGMTDVDPSRGAFQGYRLEETQPTPFICMNANDAKGTSAERHVRYLIALGLWGFTLSIISAVVGADFAQQFLEMKRMEISRVILVVIALGVAAAFTFRICHLLWSRMYFKSRLILIGIDGTFQSGEMRIGNQFSGHVQSRATVTRVQDATLRMFVSDIVTVSFGKTGKRCIMAMAPADGYVKATLDGLKEFALNQSSITAPTAMADIEIARSIGRMEAALAPTFQDSTRACPDTQRVTGQ